MPTRRAAPLLAILLAALALIAPGGASAGVIFNMTGVCNSFCGSTGQSSGDPISGWVEFNDFDSAANGSFLIPDAYYLAFGSEVLDSSVPNGWGANFLRSGQDTFQKIGANIIGPGTFKLWSSTQNIPIIFIGNCYNCAADQWVYGWSPGSSGRYAFTRETPLAVPAPGALVPVAAALLFAGALARRRR